MYHRPTLLGEDVRGETNRRDHGVNLPRVMASESPSDSILELPSNANADGQAANHQLSDNWRSGG